MGVVFRARDRLTGQDVALKRVLRTPQEWQPSPIDDRAPQRPARPTEQVTVGDQSIDVPFAQQVTRMAGLDRPHTSDTVVSIAQDQLGLALGREFRTLASLRHPNIVSVFDYGFEAAQQPFFTMELLRDAQPLLTLAKDLPFADRIRLLLSILQALTYLHRRGILHREICNPNFV
jgi:serine/threonine protein kinase